MRKFIFAILATLMIFSFSVVTAQEEVEYNNLVFGGARYDDGILMSAGVGVPIVGNLKTLAYTDFGEYNSLNFELAYIVPLNNVHFGVLAGPNADWYENVDNDPTAYVVGAAGALVGVDISPRWGVWTYYKYKFTFENDNWYQDGSHYGGGFYYRY